MKSFLAGFGQGLGSCSGCLVGCLTTFVLVVFLFLWACSVVFR